MLYVQRRRCYVVAALCNTDNSHIVAHAQLDHTGDTADRAVRRAALKPYEAAVLNAIDTERDILGDLRACALLGDKVSDGCVC